MKKVEKNSKRNIELLVDNRHYASNIVALNSINTLFIKEVTKRFKEFFGSAVNITLLDAKVQDYEALSHFTKEDVLITSISHNIVENNQEGFIIIGKGFLYAMFDVLLGAANYDGELKVKGRKFTKIENNVITKFIKNLLDAYNASLQDFIPVKFFLDTLESSPYNFNNALKNNSFCYLISTLLHKYLIQLFFYFLGNTNSFRYSNAFHNV